MTEELWQLVRVTQSRAPSELCYAVRLHDVHRFIHNWRLQNPTVEAQMLAVPLIIAPEPGNVIPVTFDSPEEILRLLT